MQPHQTGGQPMSLSQQMQELQCLRHQLQAQMRQQQHPAAAGQRHTQQLVGSNGGLVTIAQDLHRSGSLGTVSHGIHGSGSLGTMSQGLQQMQHVQFGNQLLPDPAGNQQGQQMNSFTGMSNAALSLMQQQGSGVSQMARMGGASSAQAALYMNALQASSASGAGARTQSMSEMGGMTGTARMGSAASLQQQRGSLLLGNGQQMQQLRDQRNQADAISQQLQNIGSSSSMLAVSDTQPQMAAGNTSAQLLLQQQKTIAALKRQLQGRQGGSNAGINNSSAGSMLPPSHDRHLSGSSLSGQQRQALFQMQQRSNSMSNTLGGIQDQSLGRMSLAKSPQGTNDLSSSLGSVQPISMPSIFASQNQLTRSGSDCSQTNVMGQIFGGATGGSASGASLFMQQIANGDNKQLIAPKQLLNSSEMQSTSLWQDVPLVAQSSSRSSTLSLGQPGDRQGQQIVAEIAYPSRASDRGSKNEPDSENAPGGIGNKPHGGRCSKSKDGIASAPMLGSDSSADGQQLYLDGAFEGGWQSNADLPMRRGIIFSIVKLIEQMRPDAEKMSEK